MEKNTTNQMNMYIARSAIVVNLNPVYSILKDIYYFIRLKDNKSVNFNYFLKLILKGFLLAIFLQLI